MYVLVSFSCYDHALELVEWDALVLVSFSCYSGRNSRQYNKTVGFSFFQLLRGALVFFNQNEVFQFLSVVTRRSTRYLAGSFWFQFLSVVTLKEMGLNFEKIFEFQFLSVVTNTGISQLAMSSVLVSFSCYISGGKNGPSEGFVLVSFSCYPQECPGA